MPQRQIAFSFRDFVALAIFGPLVFSLVIVNGPTSREASREVSCKNNIRQLVTASQQFESLHGRYPGYRNPMLIGDETRHVGWTVELLPELDNTPLYEEWCDPAISNPEAPYLSFLHCPGKGRPDKTKDISSYVINVGFIPGNFGEYRFPPPWDNPHGPVGTSFSETVWALSMNSAYTLATDRSVAAKHGLDWDVSLSDIVDGASHTLIFSENLKASRWSAVTGRPLRDVDVRARLGNGFGWTPEGATNSESMGAYRKSKCSSRRTTKRPSRGGGQRWLCRWAGCLVRSRGRLRRLSENADTKRRGGWPVERTLTRPLGCSSSSNSRMPHRPCLR